MIGCEESTETLEVKKSNFIPLTIGNYWIYQSYELNQYGGIVNGTQTIDSLVLPEFHKINNFITYYFVRYRNGNLLDTLFFQEYDNQVFKYSGKDLFTPNFAGDYLPIIKYDLRVDESWNLLNKVIYDYPVNIDRKEYKGIYMYTINGTYVAQDSINLGNSLYLSKIFSNKYDSKLEFKIGRKNYNPNGSYYYDTLNYYQLHKYNEWYRVAEGIGFTQLKRDAHRMNYTTEPSSTITGSESYNGWESVLLRWGKAK